MTRIDLSTPGRIVLLAGLMLAAVEVARAGGGDRRFERISLEQGLSQSTVNAIVQDPAGFLWFGTQDGLNRYDGHDFVVFRNDPSDPLSLSNNGVRALYVDRSGALWIGTSGGVNRRDPDLGTFQVYRHDPEDEQSLSHDFAWVIHQDSQGDLWAGTSGGGLNRLDPDGGTVVRYRHDPERPDSLGHDEVRAIYEDRSGALWIGTAGGLDRFDRDRGTFIHYQQDPNDPSSLSHNVVSAIHQDHSGHLWIGTEGGLDRWLGDGSNGRGRFQHFRHRSEDSTSLSHDEVRVLFTDPSGALWIGTDGGGLNRRRLDSAETSLGVFERDQSQTANPFSLSNNFVRSIFQDRSGVLWVGTDGGGLNKLDRQKNAFAHFRHDPQDANSLSSNLVFSICQDRSGELWVGTWDGLNRLDRERKRVRHYRHEPGQANSLSNNEIWPLLEDGRGELWIGTFGGLDKLDSSRQRFTHYRHDPDRPGSLSHDYVRSLYEDSDGALWVGTAGGLNRFDRTTESFTRYRRQARDPHSLSHDDIRAIWKDREGVLWLGTAGGGLNAWNLESSEAGSPVFIHYRSTVEDPTGLSNDFVRSIYEDRAGNLWVGTDNGLNKLGLPTLDRRPISHFRTSNGLPNNVVYGILEDDAGFLWISTNGGLAKLDPSTEVFKNYDARDGLQSNEFNTGAFYKGQSGELFFGGINGLNAFFPETVVDNPHPPPVAITAFRKFNQLVDLGRPIERVEEITLTPQDHVFSLDFVALDYRSPEQNHYAYRLEGFDDRWISSGTRRQATYTNLDPGRYVFRVKASNNDGFWNEDGASIRLVLEPPFWGTWWFRSMSLLAVAGALIGVHRLLMARNQRRQQEIAEQQRAAEREALIRELQGKNAELERFTYTVSHDLKSPLITIQGFLGFLERDVATGDQERISGDVLRLRSAAQQMQRLIDDLLKLSQIGSQTHPLEEVPLSELALEVRELLAVAIAEKEAEVVISPDLPVVRGDRTRLHQLLQNLMQNALQYLGDQEAPYIEVGLRSARDGQPMVFFVRDNGVGIAEDYQEKIFELFQRLETDSEGSGVGLALVQRIVELHGGQVWVESEGSGRGSSFCFTLPAPGMEGGGGGVDGS